MDKKKIIIIVLAAVLVLALIITGVILVLKGSFSGGEKNNGSDTSTVTDAPIGEAEIIIGDAEGAAGTRVKVPVSIGEHSGFMAGLLKFKYDTSALKYVTYSKGDFLTDYSFEDKNGILSFICAENGDVKEKGVLVYLEFEILKDAKTSDVEVVVDSDTMLCNYNEQVISIKGTNGKVTVK